jgi:hypothetical protein
MRVFSGCDHAGLPSPQHCGDVRQLLSRGRTVGGHGVPGGGRPYRHRHQCEVCSSSFAVSLPLVNLFVEIARCSKKICFTSFTNLLINICVEISWYGKLSTTKRLDQGHLHPLLKHPETNMSRLGIEPRPPASQATSLAKSYSNC